MTESNASSKTIDPGLLHGPVRIRSPHAPDEVHRRLEEIVERPSLARLVGTIGLGGSLGPREFRVAWQNPMFRNAFKPVLHALVIDSGTGSEIVGRFRMAPLVRLFLVVWFGLVGLALLASLSRGADGGTIAMETLLLAFGVILVRLGIWLAREHRVRIVSKLCEALDGTLV